MPTHKPFKQSKSSQKAPDEQSSEPMASETVANSFGFAWQGLKAAFNEQRNFRIHLAISVLVIAVGLSTPLSSIEWIALILTITLMLACELFNSALEACVDLAAGGQFHPLAKQAKDTAAGACLMVALLSVIIGILVFIPHWI